LLQPLQVLDAVAAGQVQENHRQHHLDVQPALAASNLDVLADRRRQPAALNQIEIQWQSCQRRQPAARTLRLILEPQRPLWQHSAPRW
jgi:hypothetical protein